VSIPNYSSLSRRGANLIMLAGGDKSTQQRYIKRAHRIAAELGAES